MRNYPNYVSYSELFSNAKVMVHYYVQVNLNCSIQQKVMPAISPKVDIKRVKNHHSGINSYDIT